MRKSLIFVALLTTATLLAQGPPPGGRRGPGGPGGPGGRGPWGGPGGAAGPGMMAVDRQVITGAPFSGIEVTENSQSLSDGNVIKNRTQTSIYRDGMGRVRTEETFTEPGANGSQTTRTMIRIHDPVAGVMRTLDPQNKTAHEMNAGPGPGRGPNPNGNGNGAGRPAPAGRGAGAATRDPNTSTETLSMQTINGIQANGSRVTRTIPAGQIGNAQALQITHETWMAVDLKVPVMVKRTDPRNGTTTTQLTNVVRSEPDPALFQIPSDYTVTKDPGRGRGPRGGGGPIR
jgi:hypothetical protein